MNWKTEKRKIDREATEAALENKSPDDCPYTDIARKNRWLEAYHREKYIIKDYNDKHSIIQSVKGAQSIEELKEAILNFIDFLYDKNIIDKKEL